MFCDLYLLRAIININVIANKTYRHFNLCNKSIYIRSGAIYRKYMIKSHDCTITTDLF